MTLTRVQIEACRNSGRDEANNRSIIGLPELDALCDAALLGLKAEKQVGKQAELVQYIIMRRDLALSPGKAAAQAGHAVQMIVNEKNAFTALGALWYQLWSTQSMTKVVLGVEGPAELQELAQRVIDAGYHAVVVRDEGRTEICPGTATCVGLQPMPRSHAQRFVGTLKVL